MDGDSLICYASVFQKTSWNSQNNFMSLFVTEKRYSSIQHCIQRRTKVHARTRRLASKKYLHHTSDQRYIPQNHVTAIVQASALEAECSSPPITRLHLYQRTTDLFLLNITHTRSKEEE